MTITTLKGGLGNQMFQYAVAFANSNEVFIDFTFIDRQSASTSQFTKRDFELSLFPNLKYKILNKRFRYILLSEQRRFKYLRKLLGIRPNLIIQKDHEFITIRKSTFMYFDGYFQSEKYFLQKREQLLKVFKFPDLDIENKKIESKISECPNSVSLHIRRGDYLKENIKKHHGVLEMDYYNTAIDLLRRQYEGIHFFVFSDDEQFASQTFGNLTDLTVVKGNNNYSWKDMALMSFCKHHIVANSSFSWWGAWLSTHENNMNIAPKRWFNPEFADFDINDYIPDNWVKI